MYSLKTNSSFDSAHFLAGYEGKCRNLHGHRWTVEVEVGGEKLMQDGQTRGMVVDFGDLKKDLREKTEEMDHCLIMEKGTLKEKTMEAAENLAKYFYEYMADKGYQVLRTTVYETPTNAATYMA